MIQLDNQQKLALGMVRAFVRSFGDEVLHLACHAAVPVVTTPELLHFLRLNFFIDTDKPVPFKAESDILLSPICNEIGDGLYEISPPIRGVLLRELVENPRFGEKRIRDIAAFLFEYRRLFSPWQDNQALDRCQQLTALNFLDPPRAKSWLEESLAAIPQGTDGERQWFIAMRAELSKLEEVLVKSPEVTEEVTAEGEPADRSSADEVVPLPYFNQTFSQTYSRYEPIEQKIESARVLVVDTYLRDERDISDVGRSYFGELIANHLRRERHLAGLGLETILNNVAALVKMPTTEVAHVSEISGAVARFKPDAVVLSSTLQDFDYYNPQLIDDFGEFIRTTQIPVLGINSGHLLVGMSFGAQIITLDKLEPREQRIDRPSEYQYRYVRITEPDDPIFRNIYPSDDVSQEKPRILRVWQSHGLQLDRVPADFKLLAQSYLCRNQMMVKRSMGQLIYTTQFQLDKSFEDWATTRTRWEHRNESRDGRILFENFLALALEHMRVH